MTTTKERLQQEQDRLAGLLLNGCFNYDLDIATVDYRDYRDIISSLEPPENYEIGYDLGGINWLERCILDRENGRTSMIRRERTYEYDAGRKLRAFNLELVTVPTVILDASEGRPTSTVLSTTWYCDELGQVVAYLQQINGETIDDIRL